MDSPSPFSQLCIKSGLSPVMVFLGGGQMATALVEGAITNGFAKKEEIVITAKSLKTVERWKARGYKNAFLNNNDVLNSYPNGIFFIAVKPQSRHELFLELRGQMKDKCFVSLMAGVDLKSLRDETEASQVMRLHPNIASAIGAGTAILSVAENVDHNRATLVRSFAECSGKCYNVDEITFDAAGTLVGCVPAWACIMVEGLADGGVLTGIPRELATQLAANAVLGCARLIVQNKEHPGVLKDKVCSAGGTTITGLRELEARGVRSACIEAVKAATGRAKEMGSKK